MHFYDWNIGDYAKKTQHLTNDEDLAYRRILDIYYDTELPITIGLSILSRRIRIDIESTKNVMEEFFPNGINKHADEKISEYHKYVGKQKSNGSMGGRPKHKLTDNPVLTQNNPVLTQNNPVPSQLLTTKPLTINQQPLNNNYKQELLKPLEQNTEKLKTTKGSRLSSNFIIPDDWITIASSINKTMTKNEIIVIADSFKDYWVSLAGSKAVKLDWVATWRNWIRSHRPANKSYASQRDESRTITASSIFKDKYIAEQTGDFLESDYEKLK